MNKIRDILDMDEIKLEKDKVIFSISELEDGSSIYYDGDLGVDTLVFTDETLETPLGDGDYILGDGGTFTVAVGIVTEYLPFQEEVVEEEVLEKEDFESKYNELLEIVNALKSDLEKFNNEKEEMKEEIKKFEVNEKLLNTKIEDLTNEPSVGSITNQPTDKIELTLLEKRLQVLDSIRKLNKK